jgi:hypothetical protein
LPEQFGLYVLDQNFPALAVSATWPPGLVVRALASVDAQLIADTDDWEVLMELDARGDVAAFVTNDARILDSAREMVALQACRLKLVVTDGVGHDSLKATGLLLVHLPDIARDEASAPMAYRLRPTGSRTPQRPGQLLNRIAARRNISPNELISTERRAIEAHLRVARPHLLSRHTRRWL